MPGEVNAAGAAAGSAGAGGSGGSGAGAGAGTGGAGAADTSGMSDAEFLSQPQQGETGKESTAIVPAEKAPAEKTAEEKKLNLAALEEGEPQWFESLKDAEAAKQARELYAYKQELSKHFKDTADAQEFFKGLPGGREEIVALQTMGKEVASLDTAIEGEDFAGHLSVAERVLNQAPGNAVSMTRAWSQTLAKSNPEAWGQISTELVNNTLKAAGIGADLVTVLGAIQEMRAAVAAGDGEAFGKAAAKILGQPEAGKVEDQAVVRARAEAASAIKERDAALTATWRNSVSTAVGAVENMCLQMIGTAFSKIDQDKSIPEKTREELTTKILAEIKGQMNADSWLNAQNDGLIGGHAKPNLQARKEDWDKVVELGKNRSKTLVNAAVIKIVEDWTKTQVAANASARERAKGGGKSTDVGAGARKPPAGKGVITEEMVRDRNLSDEELLNRF